jgi:hypothetical protein
LITEDYKIHLKNCKILDFVIILQLSQAAGAKGQQSAAEGSPIYPKNP